ncbi:translation initiation factor IF-2-like [Cervus canadensis]|uniref:translation initiation factor IF-2-like n=1 Tax=Cervus canadensis TaxID=1574408 RepID=UPI001C9E62F8|nr:translation initiation factor IF-2-like [Cervus canadensis]
MPGAPPRGFARASPISEREERREKETRAEGRVEKAKGLEVSAGPVGNVRHFPIHPRRLTTCPRDAEALEDQFFGSGRGCAPGPGGERRRPPSTALVAGDSELCSRARPAPSACPAPGRRSLALVSAPVSGAGRSPRKRKGTRTTSDGAEEEEEEEEADQQDGPCCRSSLSSRWGAGGGAGGGGGGRGPAAWDRVRVDGGSGGGGGCPGGGDGRGDSELRGATARTSAKKTISE